MLAALKVWQAQSTLQGSLVHILRLNSGVCAMYGVLFLETFFFSFSKPHKQTMRVRLEYGIPHGPVPKADMWVVLKRTVLCCPLARKV